MFDQAKVRVIAADWRGARVRHKLACYGAIRS
jgi:hypothetical protein